MIQEKHHDSQRRYQNIESSKKGKDMKFKPDNSVYID